MKIIKIMIWVVLLFGLMNYVYAVNYLHSTPVYVNGDVITGHTSLASGMIIKAAQGYWGGNVEWCSSGVVNGEILFKPAPSHVGNTAIFLQSDLILGSTSKFTADATVMGNGYSLLLTGNLSLSYQSFRAMGDLTVNGQGNTVELGAYGMFFSHGFDATISSTLRLKNMNVVIKEESWIVGNRMATLELENVNLFLTTNTSIRDMRLLIKGQVNVYGFDKELVLQGLQPSSGVQAGSTLYVGPGVTLSTKILPVRNAFDCLDPSATIWFDGCTIRPYSSDETKCYRGVNEVVSSELGWRLSKGNVFFGGSTQIENVGFDSHEKNHDPLHSFELGHDGVHEVQATVLPGAQLLVNGYLYHNPL